MKSARPRSSTRCSVVHFLGTSLPPPRRCAPIARRRGRPRRRGGHRAPRRDRAGGEPGRPTGAAGHRQRRTHRAGRGAGGGRHVVVLNGDIPLLRPETVAGLVEAHEAAGAAATVLTAEVADPTGLGRIVRAAAGGVARIVEERDASAEQRAIREINAGIYAFEAARLRAVLGKLVDRQRPGRGVPHRRVRSARRRRAAGRGARRGGRRRDARAATTGSSWPRCGALLRDRINERWMRAGVTIIDPATTWIDVTVTLGAGRRHRARTRSCAGTTTVGEGAVGRPGHHADRHDGRGAGATVVRSHCIGAEIGPRGERRPVRLPAARHAAGAAGQGRHVRGDEERRHRRGHEGPASVLRRATRRSARTPTSARPRCS